MSVPEPGGPAGPGALGGAGRPMPMPTPSPSPLPPLLMTPLSPSHSNSNSPFPSPAYAGAGLLASVQVAVRIRPIWPDEAKKDSRYALLADGSRSDSLTLDDVSLAAKRSTISPVGSTPSAGGAPGARSTDQKQYSFDHVFGTNASQELVFETAVAPILNHFIEGFNVTVIAYGQTGSGKTFTMGTGASGSAGSVSDPTSQGIVPRAANLTFLALEAKARDVLGFTWSAKVSFLEIYNDDVIDLFESVPLPDTPVSQVSPKRKNMLASSSSSSPRDGREPSREPLAVRFDKQLGTYVQGARYLPVSSPADIARLLAKGTQLRQTAATGANATSSRSHAIFSIVITQGFIAGDDVVGSITSKLNFVDLAGSERLKNTNAVGDRAKEGISINSGLLALGKVINALSASSARPSAAVHIPYRESKLTRLLQDSLGGNSQTLMIACLSPSVPDISESKSTLQFASRARSVRTRVAINKPGITVKSDDDLRDQLRLLREQLNHARAELSATEIKSSELATDLDLKSKVCLDMQDHIESLLNEITELREEQFSLASSHANSSNTLNRLGELEQTLVNRDAEIDIVIYDYQRELEILRQLVAERDRQLEVVSQVNEARLQEIIQRISVITERVEVSASSIKPVEPDSLASLPPSVDGSNAVDAQANTWFEGWLAGSKLKNPPKPPGDPGAPGTQRKRAPSLVPSTSLAMSEMLQTGELVNRMVELIEAIDARLQSSDHPEDASSASAEQLYAFTNTLHSLMGQLTSARQPLSPQERASICDQIRAKLSWLEGWLHGANGGTSPSQSDAGQIDDQASFREGVLVGSQIKHSASTAATPVDSVPPFAAPPIGPPSISKPTLQRKRAPSLVPEDKQKVETASLINQISSIAERIENRIETADENDTATTEQLLTFSESLQTMVHKLTSTDTPLDARQRQDLHEELRVYLRWLEGWLAGSRSIAQSQAKSAQPAAAASSSSSSSQLTDQQIVEQHLMMSYFQEMKLLRVQSRQSEHLRKELAQRIAILEASERRLYQLSIETHLNADGAAPAESGAAAVAAKAAVEQSLDRPARPSSMFLERDNEILTLSKQLEQLKERYNHILSSSPRHLASSPFMISGAYTRQPQELSYPHTAPADSGLPSDASPSAIASLLASGRNPDAAAAVPMSPDQPELMLAVSEFSKQLEHVRSIVSYQRDRQYAVQDYVVGAQDVDQLQDSFARLFGKYFDDTADVQSAAQVSSIHGNIGSGSDRKMESEAPVRDDEQQSQGGASGKLAAVVSKLKEDAAAKDRRIAELEQMLQAQQGQPSGFTASKALSSAGSSPSPRVAALVANFNSAVQQSAGSPVATGDRPLRSSPPLPAFASLPPHPNQQQSQASQPRNASPATLTQGLLQVNTNRSLTMESSFSPVGALLASPTTPKLNAPAVSREQRTVEQHLLLSYLNDMSNVHREFNSSVYSNNRTALQEDEEWTARLFAGVGQKPANFLTVFQVLASDLVTGVQQAAELDRQLRGTQARLRARDEYMHNTILDTARRVNDLEQLVIDLEGDKEMLINDLEASFAERRELESILISLGYDVRNMDSRTSLESRLRKIRETNDVATQTDARSASPARSAKASGADTTVASSQAGTTRSISSSPTAVNAGTQLAMDDDDDDEERNVLDDMHDVASDVSGLVEHNELLQADLALVRLQVEHLESVAHERDTVIADLLRRMGRDDNDPLKRLRSAPARTSSNSSAVHDMRMAYMSAGFDASMYQGVGGAGGTRSAVSPSGTAGENIVDPSVSRIRNVSRIRPSSVQSWADTVVSDSDTDSLRAASPDLFSPTSATGSITERQRIGAQVNVHGYQFQPQHRRLLSSGLAPPNAGVAITTAIAPGASGLPSGNTSTPNGLAVHTPATEIMSASTQATEVMVRSANSVRPPTPASASSLHEHLSFTQQILDIMAPDEHE